MMTDRYYSIDLSEPREGGGASAAGGRQQTKKKGRRSSAAKHNNKQSQGGNHSKQDNSGSRRKGESQNAGNRRRDDNRGEADRLASRPESANNSGKPKSKAGNQDNKHKNAAAGSNTDNRRKNKPVNAAAKKTGGNRNGNAGGRRRPRRQGDNRPRNQADNRLQEPQKLISDFDSGIGAGAFEDAQHERAGRKYSGVRQGLELVKSVFSPKPRNAGSRIRIIPLGGLEQIGMNITAIESDNSIVVIDCGMAFPDEEMLGIDLVIPDITYLRDNMSKIEGFFITHGHEDHIGALPYVLRNINVPVYSTRLTRALIENKLREHGLIESAKLNTVKFGEIVRAGDFDVEFIKTNHSIQDAAALAVHSPAGVVLHTGDFKVDYTPVFGDTIDLQRFAELGKHGVLALLCDSTNAVRQGFTMSEKTVGHTFETIFGENRDKRIIVATFASNVDRVQQIITVAEQYDRKVVIDGRSMINVISTAKELGYIKMKDNTLIDISEIKNYPDHQIVLIVTGSQGEPMAALSRMATGMHRKVTLTGNDVVVLSSTPIPGNEKAVSKVINELSKKRTKVIYQDTHVSGHACTEELKLIYTLVHPKFSIPVHGELRHRLAQKDIAVAIGMPRDNCHLVDTGDVVELTSDSCEVVGKVQAGPILVDGLGIGDVGNAVLKDRQSMSQNGIIVAVVSIEQSSGELVAGPEILTRGLVYVKENEDIIDESREVVLQALEHCRGVRDLNKVKNTIRNELSDYVWRRIQRTPMILAVITEV